MIPLADPHPEQHPAWRLARDLGASVATTRDAQARLLCLARPRPLPPERAFLCSQVTHVVANCGGTEKVRWATQQPGVFAVRLAWLHECGHFWRHEDEALHPLEPPAAAAAAAAAPAAATDSGAPEAR